MAVYIIIGIVYALYSSKSIFKMVDTYEGYHRYEDLLRKTPRIGKILVVIEPAIIGFWLVLLWPIFVLLDIILPILVRCRQEKYKEQMNNLENKFNNLISELDKEMTDE
jgi:hypothetical protein